MSSRNPFAVEGILALKVLFCEVLYSFKFVSEHLEIPVSQELLFLWVLEYVDE